MSDTSRPDDWKKPAAMAIPKGGFSKDEVKQGRYGPIFPKTAHSDEVGRRFRAKPAACTD